MEAPSELRLQDLKRILEAEWLSEHDEQRQTCARHLHHMHRVSVPSSWCATPDGGISSPDSFCSFLET